MRKVFLDDLPRGGKHIGKTRINWTESVDRNIKFIYDDIEGEFRISKYNKSMVTLLYGGVEFEIFTGDLAKGKIASIVGRRSKAYMYCCGDSINVRTGEVTVLKQLRIRHSLKDKGYSVRGYEYRCNSCNYVNQITEGHLKNGSGCPVCSNLVVKIGVNDMWTTNHDIATMLENPGDGYLYTEQSNKKVNWICPICDNVIENRQISQIYSNGLSCPSCSDGVSYPEKFMYNLLIQIGVNFETEKTFNWSNGRRYDFCIPELNYIIEVHGIQHYENVTRGRSLRFEQENDYNKKSVAMRNGISIYTTVDCRYSEKDYIKDSIVSSDLAKMFDLSNINWLRCHEGAISSNLVKTASYKWNSGIKNARKIGEIMHKDRNTVRKYLKQGAALGWCDYSVEAVRGSHLNKLHRKATKKVICITSNKVFESIKEANLFYGLNQSSGQIGQCCKGRAKSAGKDPKTGERLLWMYYDDYIEQKHNTKQIS